LLLKRVQYAVNQLLLQPRIDITGAQVGHNLLNGLHHHLAVLFVFVLEVVDDAGDDFRSADLVGDFFRGIDKLKDINVSNFYIKIN